MIIIWFILWQVDKNNRFLSGGRDSCSCKLNVVFFQHWEARFVLKTRIVLMNWRRSGDQQTDKILQIQNSKTQSAMEIHLTPGKVLIFSPIWPQIPFSEATIFPSELTVYSHYLVNSWALLLDQAVIWLMGTKIDLHNKNWICL